MTAIMRRFEDHWVAELDLETWVAVDDMFQQFGIASAMLTLSISGSKVRATLGEYLGELDDSGNVFYEILEIDKLSRWFGFGDRPDPRDPRDP